MPRNPSWFKPANTSGGGKRTYGRQSAVSPKTCALCSKQGSVIQSQKYSEHVYRRYECVCGHRWTTYEVTVTEEDVKEMETPAPFYYYFNPECRHGRTSFDIMNCDACVAHSNQVHKLRLEAQKAEDVKKDDDAPQG